MLAVPDQVMSVAEFLEWAEAQDEGRFELWHGHVVAMAPERVGHARTKAAVRDVLVASLRKAGLPCEALIDGPAVVIDERMSFQPDVVVNCGSRLSDDQLTSAQPIAVFEVLSPSTRHIDKTKKLFNYFRVPGLEHYVIVDLEHRAVIHHRREGEDIVQTTLLRMGTLELDALGVEVAIAEFFRDND